MRILALDSASTTGWAFLAGERVIEFGTVDARSPTRIAAFADEKLLRPPDLVVIEDSYLGENVATVKLLSRIVGRWEQAFASRGVPCELVMADAWQTGVLTGIISRKSPREERKAAAVRWVKATFGLSVSEDVADAIGMGTFVARREALAERVARVKRAG